MKDDDAVVSMWLHGRSPHTRRSYEAHSRRFLARVGKPLARITLADLQQFGDELAGDGLAVGSQCLVLSVIKSLLAFAHRLGYLPFDVGRPLRLPKRMDTLSERILSEAQVQRMLAVDSTARNHALLLLLYASGMRVSELCGLRWRDCQARGEGGQVTVFGKGGKTRVVLLPASVWSELVSIRGDAGDDAPVFLSQKHGALHPVHVRRIIRQTARRARIKAPVSPHWLRHAHASHALEHYAPLNVVQATLGHASVATTGRYLHARPNDSSSRYLADRVVNRDVLERTSQFQRQKSQRRAIRSMNLTAQIMKDLLEKSREGE